MRIWSDNGKILRVYGVSKRYRGQPRQDQSHSRNGPSKNVKEVQSLNGKVAILNRFVSRTTDKYLPFFRMLKKSFKWTAKYQQAFEDLKAYLSSPPLLSPSRPRQELFLYLAVSLAVVSSALVREKDKVKKPMYYASGALRVQKKGIHPWKSSPSL